MEILLGWFPKFDKIGIPSVAGMVMQTSLTGSVSDKNKNHYHVEKGNRLVVKSPNVGYEDDIWREYIIGLKLNQLRKDIPNFMYMFGIFKCNAVFHRRNPSALMCTKSQPIVGFSIMQFIDGKTLETMIYEQKLEPHEMILIVLQIMLALLHAKEMFQFSHNDLHPGNVMIIAEDPPRPVTYPCSFLPTKKITVTTNLIPVIIDYGMSSIYISEAKTNLDKPTRSRYDCMILIDNILQISPQEFQKELRKFTNFSIILQSHEQIISNILNKMPHHYKTYDFNKQTMTINLLGKTKPAIKCSCKVSSDVLLDRLYRLIPIQE